MSPDARGWYRHEKARIVVGHWLFMRGADVYDAVRWAMRRLGFKRWPELHRSNLLLTFASWGYLYDDLKRGDLPENQRIGGVWR